MWWRLAISSSRRRKNQAFKFIEGIFKSYKTENTSREVSKQRQSITHIRNGNFKNPKIKYIDREWN